MRTTIDLPDEVYRETKARAALAGMSMKELITRWIERGLLLDDVPSAGESGETRDLPVVIAPRGRDMPSLTSAELQALLDAEDVEAG